MLLWGVTELIILTDDAIYEKRLNGKCYIAGMFHNIIMCNI